MLRRPGSASRFLLLVVVALLAGAVLRGMNGGALATPSGAAPAAPVQEETGGGATAHAGPEGSTHAGGEHTDPFSFILLELSLIIIVAMVSRWLAEKAGQPAVLGELLVGVVIGNIGYWLDQPLFVLIMLLGEAGPLFTEIFATGLSVADAAANVFSTNQLAPGGVGHQVLQIVTGPEASRYVLMGVALWAFSSLGVILLLFMVGLESNVDEMLRVGPRALMVAVIGIVAPFLLGLWANMWLLPGSPMPVHLFVAATLCATSVGITARVFKDMGCLQTHEAKVILGAAVIDDILGLIILAMVVGIVVTGQVVLSEVLRILFLSMVFLVAVILMGRRMVSWTVPLVSALDRHHVKLLFPLALAFAMSWLANMIELASIVGAFAAGLILEEQQFEKHAVGRKMEEMIGPVERLFAPVFFVLMGMQVNLETFLEYETIGLAVVLTGVAVIGKIIAGLPAGKHVDRLSVGIGMIPRGEVGLIFASIGKGLGVVTPGLFSAVVIMVMVTTLITPMALKWSLARRKTAQAATH